jgi:hypothetical protein
MSKYDHILSEIFNGLVSGNPEDVEEIKVLHEQIGGLINKRVPKEKDSDLPFDKAPNRPREELTPLHVFFFCYRTNSDYRGAYQKTLDDDRAFLSVSRYFSQSPDHIKMWGALCRLSKLFKKAGERAEVKDEQLITSEILYRFVAVTFPTFEHAMSILGLREYGSDAPSVRPSSEEEEIHYVRFCYAVLAKIQWETSQVVQMLRTLKKLPSYWH